jgi:hypothetical protein
LKIISYLKYILWYSQSGLGAKDFLILNNQIRSIKFS